MPTITFQPLGVVVEVDAGTTILAAAIEHEIYLRHTCGGNAMCATCRCKVKEGMDKLSPMARHEAKRLKELYASPETRLSCQAQVLGDVVVEIPVPVLGT